LKDRIANCDSYKVGLTSSTTASYDNCMKCSKKYFVVDMVATTATNVCTDTPQVCTQEYTGCLQTID